MSLNYRRFDSRAPEHFPLRAAKTSRVTAERCKFFKSIKASLVLHSRSIAAWKPEWKAARVRSLESEVVATFVGSSLGEKLFLLPEIAGSFPKNKTFFPPVELH